MTKKIILLLALLGLLNASKASAQVTTLNAESAVSGSLKTDQEGLFHIARDNRDNLDIDNLWTPGKLQTLSQNRTCVWISSATGLIDAVEVSSGVLSTGGSGWAVLFDTNSINGFTAGAANGNVITVPSNAIQLHLQYTVPMISAATVTIQPRQSFYPPIPYTKGIVMCTSSADVHATVQYRELRR